MEKFNELTKTNYKRKGIPVCSKYCAVNMLEIKKDIIHSQYINNTQNTAENIEYSNTKITRKNKIFDTRKIECVSVDPLLRKKSKRKLTVSLSKKDNSPIKELNIFMVSSVSEYDESKLKNKINSFAKNTQ